MESGGMIRCTECGYKNSPVYHYCGVCGAVLQPPASKEEPVPAATVAGTKAAAVEAEARRMAGEPTPFFPPLNERPEARDTQVGGMSFLGLGQESSPSTPSYLYEDAEPSHWARYVLILILLAGGGGLAWQWWKGAFPFEPRTPSNIAQVTQPTPAPAETSPATSPAAQPSIEPVNPESSKPADTASSSPTETEPASSPAAKTETPAETKTPAPTAPENAESVPEKSAAAPVEKAERAAPKPAKPAPPPEPAVSPGEALYVQGQKYLYGTGGSPENCDLALKSMLTAASRAHPRAQSTLGTMYFTGHCVTRDLPTAYRWFAKALRQDPSNIRLEQNLNVVWQQMTPGERQLATR